MLESEASGHRRMWEEEVRARSKLSVELARVDQDRRDAIELLNSYKDKYSRASLQSKSYRSKYENGKKRSSKMEHQLDEYRRVFIIVCFFYISVAFFFYYFQHSFNEKMSNCSE